MPVEDIRHSEKQPVVLKRRWKNIKDKKTKEVGTELYLGKRVLKKKFPKTRKHSHCRVCGKPWNHRGQHNQEEK